MKIAVAGGTGVVGSQVVEAARRAGHDVTILSRSRGVDLSTGSGLDGALEGVDAVIDTANVSTMNARKATEFFETTSGHLLSAAGRANVSHVVLLSIVGVDCNPPDYYAGKLAQEQLYIRSSLPWSIVRATQFHEFAAQMFDQARLGPLHLAPRARTQPIAASEVGEHLVTAASGTPLQSVKEIAGPREEELSELIKRYARAIDHRGPVLAVSLPGKQMKGMRAGLNLPSDEAERGRQTFDQWLAQVRPQNAENRAT
ncbi:NAD(P)H-binding protein [Microbacterium sp. AZCO]|uniref:SDR family oxidoreductase n=1 Tax=Microbacterium sp. AZCO TaxID=3142976 RepID=UPI0031F38D5D